MKAKPTAVILTALPCESKAVLEHLDDVEEEEHPEGTLYEVGQFGDWRVAVAEIGSTDAALQVERTFSHFAAKVALIVGIAGGLKEEALGNVIVANEAYQRRVAFGNVEVPDLIGSTSHKLEQRARKVIRDNQWKDRLPAGTQWDSKAVIGPVTGPEISSYAEAVILDGFDFLRAALRQSEVDIAVVRGISNLINEEEAGDFKEQAARHAAAFAFEMLAQLPTKAPKPSLNTTRPRPSPESPRHRLYLRNLTVRDARCFQTLDVPFTTDDGQPRPLTLLVGRNGSGKTSFLRALALGLCQQKETSGLISKLAGEFIRQDKRGDKASEALIELSLVDPAQPDATYLTRTRVVRDESGQEIVDKETEPADFPWSDIFVCGYGVNRGAGPGSPPPSEYRRLDALASLFDDDVELVDPESVLRSLKLGDYEAEKPEEALFTHVVRHLKAVLGLAPAHRLEVTSKQVLVRGPWGTMPFHALGDGYRGTSGWLLDLWGRAYLAGGLSNGGTPAGIVLIDEIDEHLHPSWQKKLIKTLKRRFPEIQFVGTTHSAMSIVNCAHSELLASELRDGVARVHPLSGPEGRTADRILRGEWFGLTSTLDDESEALLERYQAAVRGGAGEDEVAPLRNQLQDRLGALFDSPIDELALEIAAEVRRQAEISPSERRKLVSDAAQRLRRQIAEKGFSRTRQISTMTS